MTLIRSTFLRAAIGLDATVCGLLGAAFAGGGPTVAAELSLSPAFAQPLGMFLLGYAALLAWMALRPGLPRLAVWGLIAFNTFWAIESVMLLALGWVAPNTLGEVVLLVQAAGALGVAAMQTLALRMSRAAAA